MWAGARQATVPPAWQGDYLCFFDDDDALLPQYIETWQALLREHPQERLFLPPAQNFAAIMRQTASHG